MKQLQQCLFTACCLFFISLAAMGQDHAPGDLIVQLKKGADAGPLISRLQLFEGEVTGLKAVKLLSPPLDIWLFHFDNPSLREDDFLKAMRLQPEVELAQFNHVIAERNIVPNDPQFNTQWQWLNPGGNGGVADADVDADQAWEITTGGLTATGKEIVVAVVESGINITHPDLIANIWHNLDEIPNNGTDDDNNGYLDDYDGWNIGQDNDNIPSANHGTQVSGMIGAVGDNGLGVSGINWDVKIMAVSMQGVFEANVVEAYTYPYVLRKRFNDTGGQQGAFVVAINSSWGVDDGQPADAPIWCGFYDTLGEEGILSCGATANNNVNIDQVGDLPTACPSEYLISVTATDNADFRTFSGYGIQTIDLGAPGDEIFTTSGMNSYTSSSGTSFASPLTAGVIALLYSAPCSFLAEQAIADPAATAIQVRDALFGGVDVKPNLVPEVKTGGRVNAFKSLQLLLETCGPCQPASHLEAVSLTDVSATIGWDGPSDALEYILRYRLQGAAVWDTIPNVNNPYVMNGLSGCETYEVQVYTICQDTASGFSGSYFFQTEGCCIPPEDIDVTNITSAGAFVQWNSVFAAQGYSLVVEPLDTSLTATTFAPAGNSFSVTGLAPCTGYLATLISDCGGGLSSDPSPSVVFYTLCPCPAPENADTSQVGQQTALYSWDSAENAGTYVVRYKELTAVDWTLVGVPTTNILLENLISCKNYRVQVKSVCPIAESSYTDALLFKTHCAPSSTGNPGVLTAEMHVLPNPFHDQVMVWVATYETKRMTIQVYDMLGRVVWHKNYGRVQEGRHLMELQLDALPVGVYWIRMDTDDLFMAEKLIKQ